MPSVDRPHRCDSLWAVPTRERSGFLGGSALPTRKCQHMAAMCPESGPPKHAPDELPRPRDSLTCCFSLSEHAASTGVLEPDLSPLFSSPLYVLSERAPCLHHHGSAA